MSVPSIVTQHLVAAAVCLAGLTVAGGKRAPVHAPAPPTAAAIQLGSSEAEVTPASPGSSVLSHPCPDQGHHLVVDPGEGRPVMILGSDGKTVTSSRAGERRPVSFIERCE